MSGLRSSYAWIKHLPLAAVVLDDAGHPQEWNEAFDRLVAGLIPESELSAGRDLLARQVRSQAGQCPDATELVVSAVNRHGKVRKLQTWKSALPGASRAPGCLLVVLVPLAGPAADDAAGETELLRALMDHTPDNIYFKDRQSRFLKINPALASWLGLDRPEGAVGKTDFDFFAKEHAQQAFDDEQQVMESGEALVGKGEKETWPDGHVTWVSTTKVPLRGPGGAIVGTLGISRDITQQKLVEEELNRTNELLETIFSSIPVRIAYMDTRFNFIRVNRAYAEAAQRDPSFFVAKNYFDLYPSTQNEAIFNRVVQTCRPHFEPNKSFADAQNPEHGTTYWDWSLEPVLDLEGELKGVVLSLIDVTERTRVEQELEVSREDLRRLSARLESVVEEERRRIAHELHDELGQSLTALRMELSRAAQENLRVPGLSARFRSILESIGTCIETVRSISQELRPAILDQLGLTAAIEWHAAEFQRRTGITCGLESELGEADLRGEVSVALFRIIQEALTNVARHSSASRAVVRLSRAFGGLCIEIMDNGCGLDLSALDNSRSLGILGMRERASRLGGTFAIQSRPQVDGTTIEVVIPERALPRGAGRDAQCARGA